MREKNGKGIYDIPANWSSFRKKGKKHEAAIICRQRGGGIRKLSLHSLQCRGMGSQNLEGKVGGGGGCQPREAISRKKKRMKTQSGEHFVASKRHIETESSGKKGTASARRWAARAA